VIQAMMMVILFGFIAAVVIAWAYELTPEGIKREADVDRSQSVAPQTGQKLDRIIIGFLVLAVAYFIYDKQTATPVVAAPEPVQTAQEEVAAPEIVTEPSIAVLPFADMSPDKDQEYFSDGIAEELLNLLVRVDGLKVASRTSAFTFKNSNLNIAEIADELKVDHILEGSIRKADNRVRITAQLIDAATDRHLWSDTYDRDLEDIFGIQDEIANAIVVALRTELGVLADTGTLSAGVATDNLDAYQLYLRARGLFLARAELETAVALFEQAVEMDPGFAKAWAGLAATYSVVESWGIVGRDFFALAAQAADTALELDPSLSTPWAVKAQVANENGDMVSGMANLDKAIELDPQNATHFLWRGIDSSTLGFHDKSVADLKHCLELDPAYENCRRHLSFTYFILNENEKGAAYYQEGAERGFTGSNGVSFQRFVTLGNRMLATQLVWEGEEIGSTFPGKEVLDATQFPDRDHSRGLAKLEHHLESAGHDPRQFGLIFSLFKAYHRVEPMTFFPRWVWLDENTGFRKSEYFKPYLESLGAPAYWRENGFPPACRPISEEDFECD
jgi:TolB-like protein